MKKNLNQVLLFGLAASLICISAQDVQSDEREIAMSTPQERCPTPDECKGRRFKASDCSSSPASYDRDVYTSGKGDGSSEKSSRRGGSCDRHEKSEKHDAKSNCNNNCKRKGAAKIAQEE